MEAETEQLTMTMSERMPEYAREYFDQQQHQEDDQIVEPPYQVSYCHTGLSAYIVTLRTGEVSLWPSVTPFFGPQNCH